MLKILYASCLGLSSIELFVAARSREKFTQIHYLRASWSFMSSMLIL